VLKGMRISGAVANLNVIEMKRRMRASSWDTGSSDFQSAIHPFLDQAQQ